MLTQTESHQMLYDAILARYPAVRGQWHLVPDAALRRMVAEVRRAGDLWPYVPEWHADGSVGLTWALAQPPHVAWQH